MKIVDVAAFYAPRGGGVRVYIDQKLAWGAAAGHEIVVVAPGRETRTEIRGPGARIEWIASPRLQVDWRYHYFKSAEPIHRLLDRERPDFVEASSPFRTATIVKAWRGGAPRSLFMHADPVAAYGYRWLGGIAKVATIDRALAFAWHYLRELSTGFDAVVSASPGLSERLIAQGLRNVVTNPMGVEAATFSPRLRDEQLREELLRRCGLPAEATLLLGIGRLSPEKRWPMVVNAAIAAAAHRPVGLVLVGDGPQRRKIERLVRGHSHVQMIAPIGDRSALARLMASADALIHGCDAETFSMVAAEARASGLPLIVPDRGGAADQAKSAGGHLFRAGDAADAARAIALLSPGAKLEPQPPARTMTAHFADLLALYRSLAPEHARAA